MNKISTYNYSWLWMYRNFIALLSVGFCLFLLTIITKGMQTLIDDPLPTLFIWFVICIFSILRVYKERSLTKRLIIDNHIVKIIRYNKKVTDFDISEISKLEILEPSKSINGFAIKEMLIKIYGKDDCIVPVNIKNFDELFEVLSGG